MFLIAYLLIFSFSLINCSDSSSTAAAAAAPVSILSLPEEEKMKYIRVIHQTLSDVGQFINRKHQGINIIKPYPLNFSKKSYHPVYVNKSASSIRTDEILEGERKINCGLLLCTYSENNKSKDYALITPWGILNLFSQLNSDKAIKYGPDKFENKLFDILRKNLNIEFDLEDYPSVLEKYTYSQANFDISISTKDDKTIKSQKADIHLIKRFFGRSDIRVVPISTFTSGGYDYGCRPEVKEVMPTYYNLNPKDSTRFPKPSFRHLTTHNKHKDHENMTRDFCDNITKHKAALTIQRFMQTHTASHKKARIAPAGGAGGGSGEIVE